MIMKRGLLSIMGRCMFILTGVFGSRNQETACVEFKCPTDTGKSEGGAKQSPGDRRQEQEWSIMKGREHTSGNDGCVHWVGCGRFQGYVDLLYK